MPPRKQILHLQNARNQKQNCSHQQRIDSLRFVFSVLVHGSSYKTTSQIFLWNNFIPPSKTAFYQLQNQIKDVILDFAKESCNKWRCDPMRSDVIAFDGSWSHRRNASHCVVEIVDPKTRKILDFEIVFKATGKSKGNFDGPSNQMEVECLRRLIPRWKNDEKVRFYVHDKDAKTKCLIQDQQWEIEELIDKNHLMKSYERKWNKYKRTAPSKFYGLHDRLRRYFILILKEDMDINEKTKQWINAANHLIGDHSKCIHGTLDDSYTIWNAGQENEQDLQCLKLFLTSSAKLLMHCDTNVSTQMCESFHAVKAHLANKLLNWSTSWEIRVACAILNINESSWKFELYRRLGLPTLDRTVQRQIHEIEAERDREIEKRRTPEYQKTAREYRAQKRTKIKNIIKNKEVMYKPLDNNKVVKRKIRKMPKKIGNIHQYFRNMGFTGTEKDDEDDNDFVLVEEDSEDDYDYDYYCDEFLPDDYDNEFVLYSSEEEENEEEEEKEEN